MRWGEIKRAMELTHAGGKTFPLKMNMVLIIQLPLKMWECESKEHAMEKSINHYPQ